MSNVRFQLNYYRVDKRDFAVGDKIESAQEYYSKFAGIAKTVEDTLELHRPSHKTKRTSCVFAFNNEACAKRHWSLMTDGKLYLVGLNENEILHRGDMAIMDEMKEMLENNHDVTALAQKYWAGDLSTKPVIEILTSSITVIEIISKSDVERRAFLKQRWGFSSAT